MGKLVSLKAMVLLAMTRVLLCWEKKQMNSYLVPAIGPLLVRLTNLINLLCQSCCWLLFGFLTTPVKIRAMTQRCIMTPLANDSKLFNKSAVHQRLTISGEMFWDRTLCSDLRYTFVSQKTQQVNPTQPSIVQAVYNNNVIFKL